MDPITVTMLRELDINKDDYMIKGGKIHCSLESPHTIRWGKFFKEYGTIYINKPTLGISDGNRKLVNHHYKVFFIYDTTISECTSFTGSLHGFSFAPYQSLLDNKIPDNTTFVALKCLLLCGTTMPINCFSTTKTTWSKHKSYSFYSLLGSSFTITIRTLITRFVLASFSSTIRLMRLFLLRKTYFPTMLLIYLQRSVT